MTRNILSCAVCVRRAIRNITNDASSTASSGVLFGIQRDSKHRGYATAAASFAVPAAQKATSAIQASDTNVDQAENKKKDKARAERRVKNLLAKVDDPWHLAKQVQRSLEEDNFDEALLLTQRASKDRQMTVAWNHLISYQFEKQRLRAAMKLYNDMKKRAQLPNAQTFTAIFRGCAKSDHPKLAVAEAVKYYNVLLGDKRIEPNSIHLNAVLNVCARAGDIEQMMLIADTADDSARTPTAFTYTTIFNGLRHHTIQGNKDLSEKEKARNLEQLVARAKGIWVEVMRKWNQGRLQIDEELVCAMARVLNSSPSTPERRQVFDLLEQTMGVPNLDRKSSDSVDNNDASALVPDAVVARKAGYAVPAQNTLALVLTTLSSSKRTTSGVKYWNMLVRNYGIIPDQDNWHRMFGMLRVAKASAHAASVVEFLPNENVGRIPYKLAMEACVHDNINVNVMRNADKILKSMIKRLDVPDMQVLRLYLRVALVSHAKFRKDSREGQDAEAREGYGEQISHALAQLQEPFILLYNHYFQKDAKPLDEKAANIRLNDQSEVIALARHMYSAMNKVINEEMLPAEGIAKMREKAGWINKRIQRFFSGREKREPNLPSVKERIANREAAEAGGNVTEQPSKGRDGSFIWNTLRSKAQHV